MNGKRNEQLYTVKGGDEIETEGLSQVVRFPNETSSEKDGARRRRREDQL